MAKYLLLKHYRGAPAAVNDVPMDQWTPEELSAHLQYMQDFADRLEGTGEFVDGVPGEYLAGAGKFLDGEARAGFEQSCRQLYGQMARIAITPSWARYYHYSTGRAPQFLVDLAAKNLT